MDNRMAALIGMVVGSFIAIWALAKLFEWALLKRITDNPAISKVGSVATAWVAASIIWAFNTYTPHYARDHGIYQGLGRYFLAAAVLAGIAAHRAHKQDRYLEREQDYDSANLKDIFK